MPFSGKENCDGLLRNARGKLPLLPSNNPAKRINGKKMRDTRLSLTGSSLGGMYSCWGIYTTPWQEIMKAFYPGYFSECRKQIQFCGRFSTFPDIIRKKREGNGGRTILGHK
jgi:hypothetical protein